MTPWTARCQWATCNSQRWMIWVDPTAALTTWMAHKLSKSHKQMLHQSMISHLLRKLKNQLLMPLLPNHHQRLRQPNSLQLMLLLLSNHQLVIWKVKSHQNENVKRP